ncbi:LysB family phage lysis regulatory protein [Pseudomonas sp. v388]|nr:LysB family phage lysis regulatory protein [Pseudomonas sp. v388]
MITLVALRKALWIAAFIAAAALFIWSQQKRIALSESRRQLAVQQANAAQQEASRYREAIQTLGSTLDQERLAQTKLRNTSDQLRSSLADRQRQIEDLKRENRALQNWAVQPLPDLARRLRERPALTGADAYRQWLSSRNPLPATGNTPEQ